MADDRLNNRDTKTVQWGHHYIRWREQKGPHDKLQRGSGDTKPENRERWGRGGGGGGRREEKPYIKFISRGSNKDLHKLLNKLIHHRNNREGARWGSCSSFSHIHSIHQSLRGNANMFSYNRGCYVKSPVTLQYDLLQPMFSVIRDHIPN